MTDPFNFLLTKIREFKGIIKLILWSTCGIGEVNRYV